MIERVHLMGNLGKEFGELWEVNCTTVSECLRLIECQVPTFRKYLIDIVQQGTNFAVRTGEELLGTGEELFMNVNAEDVYITEVPAGSGGWAKIIVGALLIAAAVFAPWALGLYGAATVTVGTAVTSTAVLTGWGTALGWALASIGLNLIMAGVNELLMPKVDKGKQGGAMFSGPINTLKQGQPVPLLYGELIVGGAPISATFTKAKITSAGIAYNSAAANYSSMPRYTPGNETTFTNPDNFNQYYNLQELYSINPWGPN